MKLALWCFVAPLLTACSIATLVPPATPSSAPRYILWSQHMTSNGELWWRKELGPVSRDECRAALKRATTRDKVGFTKHYDISSAFLEKLFGQPATPDKGTWVSCWPDGYRYGEPDE